MYLYVRNGTGCLEKWSFLRAGLYCINAGVHDAKVLGSLLEVSRDSAKPTKLIAEQENNFWKNCGKR